MQGLNGVLAPCSHGNAVHSSRNPELPQWEEEGLSGKGAGPRKPADQTSVPRTHEQLNLVIHICHRSTEGEGRQRGESHLRACRSASLVYAVKQQKNKGPKFTPTRWKEKTNSPKLLSHLHTHTVEHAIAGWIKTQDANMSWNHLRHTKKTKLIFFSLSLSVYDLCKLVFVSLPSSLP